MLLTCYERALRKLHSVQSCETHSTVLSSPTTLIHTDLLATIRYTCEWREDALNHPKLSNLCHHNIKEVQTRQWKNCIIGTEKYTFFAELPEWNRTRDLWPGPQRDIFITIDSFADNSYPPTRISSYDDRIPDNLSPIPTPVHWHYDTTTNHHLPRPKTTSPQNQCG